MTGESIVGSSAERDHAPIGAHERIVHVEVVTSGAAQARDPPRVLDDDLIGREDRDAQAGLAALAVELDAVSVDPVGVLTAAGEAPPPVHLVAAVDGRDRAGRVERPGHDGARIGEQRVQGVTRQPGQVDPGAATDHGDPAGRRIGAGERLEDLERCRHVGADAAEAARPQQLEASRVDQLPEEIGRHSPRRLDLGRSSRNRGCQFVDGVEHVVRRPGRGVHLRHVDAPFSAFVGLR